MLKSKRVFALLCALAMLFGLASCAQDTGAEAPGGDAENLSNTDNMTENSPQQGEEIRKKIYVAWSISQESYSFLSTLDAIEAAGGEPVVLDMARSADLRYDEEGKLVDATDEHGILLPEAAKLVKTNTWQGSNVEELMEGVTCVVFPGGPDFSPTLFYRKQPWHGIEEDTEFCAERDVSDYILLSYCLEKDIPVLALCRGMQMLAVVSGADMTQDLGQWFKAQGKEYHSLHRDPERKIMVPHLVVVMSRDSLLYKVTGRDVIEGVPSWHHQAVTGVEGTRLRVTAETFTDGVQVIEAVERPDKRFCLGVQYHPEVLARMHKEADERAGSFMDLDAALCYFRALLEASE